MKPRRLAVGARRGMHDRRALRVGTRAAVGTINPFELGVVAGNWGHGCWGAVVRIRLFARGGSVAEERVASDAAKWERGAIFSRRFPGTFSRGACTARHTRNNIARIRSGGSMILGFHSIISNYGFWLPNEPRGS